MLGSTAIPETPICGKLSDKGVQVVPAFVDFQIPPAGAPMYIVFGLDGSTYTIFTLPCPEDQEPVLECVNGPTGSQLLAGSIKRLLDLFAFAAFF